MGWYFFLHELVCKEVRIFASTPKEDIVKLPFISVSIVAYTAVAVAVICYANL